MLLLLDNLEQVVERAPELGSLVKRMPQPRAACTSPRAPARAGRGRVRRAAAREPKLSRSSASARSRADETIAELAGASTTCRSRRAGGRPYQRADAAQILERLSQRLDLLRAAATPIPASRRCERRSSGATSSSPPMNSSCSPACPSSPAAAHWKRQRGLRCRARHPASLVDKSLLRFTDGRYWMLRHPRVCGRYVSRRWRDPKPSCRVLPGSCSQGRPGA